MDHSAIIHNTYDGSLADGQTKQHLATAWSLPGYEHNGYAPRTEQVYMHQQKINLPLLSSPCPAIYVFAIALPCVKEVCLRCTKKY